jgi:hypothetical protein
MRIGIFFIYIKVLLVATILTSCFLAKEIKVFTRFSSLDCDASPQYKSLLELFLPPNQSQLGFHQGLNLIGISPEIS